MNKWWDRGWNPISGCVKCDVGCENCYARNLATKRNKEFDFFFNKKELKKKFDDTEEFIFVCSQSDLFQEKTEQDMIDNVFERMNLEKNKKFAILTKRSKNMLEYFESFDDKKFEDFNRMIFGVSLSTNDSKYRIDDLLECKHIKHRFVCVEPIIENVSIREYLSTGKIDWVVIGAETGENKRECKEEWIDNLMKECRDVNVPVFVVNGMNERQKNTKEFFEEFKPKK